MRHALELHDSLVAGTIESHGGRVLTTHGEGDSFFAVFPLATQAVAAACAIQEQLTAQPGREESRLLVRMAVHSGEAGGDYRGRAANRCARLRACAHGGQVLLSASTAELVRESLPAGVRLLDLGKHRLRDLPRRERIFQLIIPGAPSAFPPLRSVKVGEHARLDLLDQVRRHWLQSEQGQPLNDFSRIELGLSERPQAVDNPLRTVLRLVDEPDRPLDRGIPIAAVYRKLGRQLLILGEPGAGKTTMLLELADQLIEGIDDPSTEPMPVIFHLSSWAAERRGLPDWLVDELHKRYGVSRKLGRSWIEGEQVIPLLDGLDEVAVEHRKACMATINEFHSAHGQLPLVVCSRVGEYQALDVKLQFRGAIVIQPLTRDEVESYLWQAGQPLAGVRAVLHDDEQLWELLTTPLFLRIVALAYRGKSRDAVHGSGSLEERRRRLLGDYVDAMFRRPRATTMPARYSRRQTEAWLTWLARAMRDHAQPLFYVDWIQPIWLPTRAQRRLVTLGVAVSVGLIIMPVFGLVFGLGVGLVLVLVNAPVNGLLVTLYNGLKFGVFAGLLFGPVYGILGGVNAYGRGVTPVQHSRWSLATMRRNLRKTVSVGLVFGLVFGLVIGLFFGLRNGFGTGLEAALEYGPPVGLSVSSIAVLGGGLEARRHVAPAGPGEGMETSRRSALVSGLGGGLAAGLAIALAFVPIATLAALRNGFPPGTALRYGLLDGLLGGLFLGLTFGLIFGLRRGGAAYVRHVALRWLLSRYQLAPWDFVAFLEHASTLILLRRRGGGYEFMHRLLLDYFASLKPEPPAVSQ
jgi:hypothetical protein